MPIIAEIGSNFEGSLTRAKEMIQAVAEAGADIAKFQLFKPEQYPHNIPLPEKWIPELQEAGAKNAIGILFSVFYPVERYSLGGVVKIAYSQRHNFPLVEYYKYHRLIVSGDVHTMWPRWTEVKLFCVPKYPATLSDYKSCSDTARYDGISDHTTGIELLIWRKPKWVEKHVKLGDEKISPDAGAFAINMKELKELCQILKK